MKAAAFQECYAAEYGKKCAHDGYVVKGCADCDSRVGGCTHLVTPEGETITHDEFEIRRAMSQAVLDFDRVLAALNAFDFLEAKGAAHVGQRAMQLAISHRMERRKK